MPGIAPEHFFGLLDEQDLRDLVPVHVMQTLDSAFEGHIPVEALRRAAMSVLDLAELLDDPAMRKRLIDLLPDIKRAEFEQRIGIDNIATAKWSLGNTRSARQFFGLIEDCIATPALPSVQSVHAEYSLFGYQRDAIARLRPLLWDDLRRAVLHLPTGAGKTRTAMHVVAESLLKNEPSVVVWLASGRELLEQAVSAFAEAWRHLGNRSLHIGTMWGAQLPDLENFNDGLLVIGLAKGRTVMAKHDPDWAMKLSARTRLVVFDEAHQSIARTYSSLTDQLTHDYRCALLGLTATPGRTWADIDEDGKLASYYGCNKVDLKMTGNSPIEHLVNHGYLARPTFRTLTAHPYIEPDSSSTTADVDSLDSSMSTAYITSVIFAISELLEHEHRRILIFAASVEQARLISAILGAKGTRSAAVTGTTSVHVRKRVIDAFRRCDLDPMILCNYGVLTTGFDAPTASAVVIARPTASLVLYSQMVGRAIRGPKAGGTATCEVVTIVDPSLPGFGDIAEAFYNWEDVW